MGASSAEAGQAASTAMIRPPPTPQSQAPSGFSAYSSSASQFRLSAKLNREAQCLSPPQQFNFHFIPHIVLTDHVHHPLISLDGLSINLDDDVIALHAGLFRRCIWIASLDAATIRIIQPNHAK